MECGAWWCWLRKNNKNVVEVVEKIKKCGGGKQ